MSKDRALTGAAGEHYIAFRLAAMGYAVGLITRGTRTVDMVVANPDTSKFHYHRYQDNEESS